MPNENNSTPILNKLFSADVADKSFKDPDTGETRNYSTLDITIKLNGKKTRSKYHATKKQKLRRPSNRCS